MGGEERARVEMGNGQGNEGELGKERRKILNACTFVLDINRYFMAVAFWYMHTWSGRGSGALTKVSLCRWR